MKSTNDYLDALARKFPRRDGSPASDYGLADLLGLSGQTISRYRKGHNRFDEAVALRVAELLDLDPAIVLLDTAAERTKCPAAKEVWERIAKRVSAGAMAVLLSVSVAFLVDAPSAQASQTTASAQPGGATNNIHYTQLARLVRRLRDAVRRLFQPHRPVWA